MVSKRKFFEKHAALKKTFFRRNPHHLSISRMKYLDFQINPIKKEKFGGP
jgi:hypothetical protein